MNSGVCYLLFAASEWYFVLCSFLHNMTKAFLTKVGFYRDFDMFQECDLSCESSLNSSEAIEILIYEYLFRLSYGSSTRW